MDKGCTILLYVVRHGETTLNKDKVFRGNSDHPLDSGGREQAHDLKDIFTPIELSFIVCSSKKRAAATAEIIAQAHKNIPFIESKELYPWNVGDFGGLKKTKENVDELQLYVDNPSLVVPGGTSLNTFKNRVQPVIHEAVLKGFENRVPGLLTTHSSVIHEVGAMYGGHHEAAHVKPGGISVIYLKNDKFDVEPIYLPDTNASTQNILGVKSGRGRSDLTS